MIYSFPPIIGEDSRVLILGSMPSVISLERAEYYGNRQNYFWPLLFSLFDEPYTDNYEEKKQLILRHHLALWDVLASCERTGSLDSQIVRETVNDFEAFFALYPQIKTICFNGGKAHQSFKKHYPQLLAAKEYHILPSTSPAHTMKREEKREKWQIICQLCN